MTTQRITIDYLRHVLREVAGEDESVDLDGDILDTPFADLGYDSLALLELSGRVQRDHGVHLADDTAARAVTPRDFIGLVNEAPAGAR